MNSVNAEAFPGEWVKVARSCEVRSGGKVKRYGRPPAGIAGADTIPGTGSQALPVQ